MANTREKLEELARTSRELGRNISELMGEGQQEGRERMHQMTDTAKHKWEEMRHKAQEKGKEIDKMAHEHVWTTAAIAAVVGAMVGLIMSLIFRRK